MNILGLIRSVIYYVRNESTKFFYADFTFAQGAEDSIVEFYFGSRKNRVYADVGCYDPYRFSNSYKLQKDCDWKLINIDTNPAVIEKFNIEKPDDTNLNIGIGAVEEEKPFYIYKDANSKKGSSQSSFEKNNEPGLILQETKNVPIRRLDNLFKELNLKEIDVLDVDVEGMDYEVLTSNDWDVYRPKLVLVESVLDDVKDRVNSKIVKFMESKDNSLKACLPLANVFIKNGMKYNGYGQLILD